MIYQWTGQPGHGKTLHAIDQAIDFRDAGRLVFVCNVRGFDYEKARMLPLTPEEFKDWPNTVPEGAVVLVDECYEKGMLTKRRPGSTVPPHVERLAVHRHTGRDFIFVCQSPDRQMDDFIHDLIEQHVHVRRRFGLPFAHLRIFDRFQKNPETANPLILKRVKLPRRPMGLYESTVLDTTQKKIPWYYPAAIVLLLSIVAGAWYLVGRVKDQLGGELEQGQLAQLDTGAAEDGAGATAVAATPAPTGPTRETDYVAWLTPRIVGQPWTAPAYDKLSVPPQAPRLFCMESQAGNRADGSHAPGSCSCITEQGTSYTLPQAQCHIVATRGQYEPFRDENIGDRRRLDDSTQLRRLGAADQAAGVGAAHGDRSYGAAITTPGQIGAYGDLGIEPNPGPRSENPGWGTGG
ncbi:MAG TPA: zonular occludens toxin domain-containing protein [Lysobacter sp.]